MGFKDSVEFNVTCERMEGLKNDFKVLDLSSPKDTVTSSQYGESHV